MRTTTAENDRRTREEFKYGPFCSKMDVERHVKSTQSGGEDH